MSKKKVKLVEVEYIDKYEVRPWTLEKLEKLLPVLSTLAIKFKEAGITLESAEKKFMSAATLIIPQLKTIIGITVGVPEDEVSGLDLTLTVRLSLTIFKQNVLTLKNLLAPALQIMKEMTGA